MNECNQYNYISATSTNQQNNSKRGALILLRQIIEKYYFYWQCVQFVLITYTIISASFVLSFHQYYQEIQRQLLLIHIIIYILFIIDLIVKSLIAEKTRKNIQKKIDYQQGVVYTYLFKDFMILDMCNLLVQFIFFITPYAEARYFKLVILLRIPDIFVFNNAIYLLINKRYILKLLYTIVKLTYVYFFIVHYFGSIFFLIDRKAIDEQWYGPFNLNPNLYYQGLLLCYSPIEQFDVYGKYLYGIYFSSSTISMIAYGDIIGKNPAQQIYVLFLMVFSTISIALILQQLITVVNITLGQSQFIKSYNGLKSFMDCKDVPFKVQNRVRSYLIYVDYEKNLQDQDPVLSKLPLKLRKDIHYYRYGQIVTQPFQIITNDVKDFYWLTNEIQQLTYHADMHIFQTFTKLEATPLSNTSFFCLQSGQTIFYTQYDQTSKSIALCSRKYYNFYQWLTDSKTRFGAIAITLCKILILRPQKLQQFGIVSKKTKNIKQAGQKAKCRQIAAQKLLQNCICQYQGHQIDECPRMHLIADNINRPIQPQYQHHVIKIDSILSSEKYQNLRNDQKRKNTKSAKLYRNQKKKKQIVNQSDYIDILVSIITSMKNVVSTTDQVVFFQQDSKYDDKGVDHAWSIERRNNQF